MGAYHHILTPFQISIKDNAALEKQLLSLFGEDFSLQSTNYIERFSPELPNGSRLDWSYQEKTFALSDEIVRKEFAAFCRVLFEEWKNICETKFKGKFYAQTEQPEEQEKLILTMEALLKKYDLKDRKLREEMKKVRENYYFAIDNIYPQVVYNGYPLKTDLHTDLLAINYLYSYEKMGIYPDEYAAMFLLVDRMKEKYSKQFVMAKYVFVAGY